MENSTIIKFDESVESVYAGLYLKSLIGVYYLPKFNGFVGWMRQEHLLWTSNILKSYQQALDIAKTKACEWIVYEKMRPCILIKIYNIKILAINESGKSFFGQQTGENFYNVLPRSSLLNLSIGDSLNHQNLLYHRIDFGLCLVLASKNT